MIALKVRARKLGTDAMLAFASPPWQSYLLSDEERVERSHMVSQIVPRLYLTNCRNVQNEATLKEYGVTHVLSVIETPPRLPRHMKLKTLHVPVTDYYSSPLLEHLDKTTEFIKSALEENDTNVVFVHCLLGISRSATVVVAYINATTDMRPTQAIEFVASKRAAICPNPGFRRQLERYDRTLYARKLIAKLKNKEHVTIPSEEKVQQTLKKFRAMGCVLTREDVVPLVGDPSQVELLAEIQNRSEEDVSELPEYYYDDDQTTIAVEFNADELDY